MQTLDDNHTEQFSTMTTELGSSLISNLTNSSVRSPRLLMVAYNFPPVGGAGVQRPVKWVKNLGRFGWEVTVLTVENPSVPVRDESLLADIPEEVVVDRAKTWEPDYRTKLGFIGQSKTITRGFVARVKSSMKHVANLAIKATLQPDPQILWVHNAIRVGRQILRRRVHDVILVTAPPYSSFFVGTSLARQFNLPLVLDFRDEWDMSGKYLENAQRDVFSRFVQDRMQKHVLKRADAVVATTMASTANLASKLARLKKATTRTVTIYNGFDSEDFDVKSNPPAKAAATDSCSEEISKTTSFDNRPQHATKTFRLLYTGTLWNLTTIEPLVEAVTQLNDASPELVSNLELVCVGRKTPEQTSILERLRGTRCRLEMIDYCEHAKVLDWLRSTHAVCLLLSDVAGAERVVPAKLFEYLANRKDMLAIVPCGETADIVRRFFPLGHFEPKDIDGIAGWLKSRLSPGASTECRISEMQDISEYSRITQTERLVGLLNELVLQRNSKGKTAS